MRALFSLFFWLVLLPALGVAWLAMLFAEPGWAIAALIGFVLALWQRL